LKATFESLPRFDAKKMYDELYDNSIIVHLSTEITKEVAVNETVTRHGLLDCGERHYSDIVRYYDNNHNNVLLEGYFGEEKGYGRVIESKHHITSWFYGSIFKEEGLSNKAKSKIEFYISKIVKDKYWNKQVICSKNLNITGCVKRSEKPNESGFNYDIMSDSRIERIQKIFDAPIDDVELDFATKNTLETVKSLNAKDILQHL